MFLFTDIKFYLRTQLAQPGRVLLCASFWSSLVLVSIMAADREPPFKLLSYSIQEVRAGETAVIEAEAYRNMKKKCSVTYSRYVYDSNGYRLDIANRQKLSVAGRELGIIEAPNKVRILVPLPADMKPGRSKFYTAYEYVCNPIHKIIPIYYDMYIEFDVLPYTAR